MRAAPLLLTIAALTAGASAFARDPDPDLSAEADGPILEDTTSKQAAACHQLGSDHKLLIGLYDGGAVRFKRCTAGSAPDGPHVSFFESGAPRAEGAYQSGRLSGHWTRWYAGGAKRDEGDWRDGHPSGHWRFGYEAGSPKAEGDFQDGKLSGSWTYWYPNGAKREEGAYENDRRVCFWSHWNEDGDFSGGSAGEPTSTPCGRLVVEERPGNLRNQGWLWHFRVDQLTWIQNSGGLSYAFEGSWNPAYFFLGDFGLALDAGAGPQKASGSSMFFTFKYELLLAWHLAALGGLDLEAGGGSRVWVGYGGNNATVSFNAGSGALKFAFVDRAFIGYSASFIPANDLTHEFRIGVGLKF